MKLIAYTIDGADVDIRPAPLERPWMDDTDQRYAYRCLPLNIANCFGWEIRCPSGFHAIWDGEKGTGAIKVTSPAAKPLATSHFGSGILTFHLPCIFRTEPGYDLFVFGPTNRPKDGIFALTGVVETDWAPSTFTMNWMFTQPEVEVEFEKGEPFCQFFPIKRGSIETVDPEFRPLHADPELETAYGDWNAARKSFNKDLRKPGSMAQAQRWQKHYHKGLGADGAALAPSDHTTRLRVKDFRPIDVLK